MDLNTVVLGESYGDFQAACRAMSWVCISVSGASGRGGSAASYVDHHMSVAASSSRFGDAMEYPKNPCAPNVIVTGSFFRPLRSSGDSEDKGRKPPTPVYPLVTLSIKYISKKGMHLLVFREVLLTENALSRDTFDTISTDNEVCLVHSAIRKFDFDAVLDFTYRNRLLTPFNSTLRYIL